MDAMEAILTRRSVRQFIDKPVSEALVRKILAAATSAPSAGNQQPWHYIVIDDRQLLDRIPTIHPHSTMLKQAPLAILVCAAPELEKHIGYWVQDCSATTQNTLLALRALGLSGVWLGIYPREDRVKGLRALLNIPENIVPFALIAVGYSNVEQCFVDRYDENRVHRNQW